MNGFRKVKCEMHSWDPHRQQINQSKNNQNKIGLNRPIKCLHYFKGLLTFALKVCVRLFVDFIFEIRNWKNRLKWWKNDLLFFSPSAIFVRCTFTLRTFEIETELQLTKRLRNQFYLCSSFILDAGKKLNEHLCMK